MLLIQKHNRLVCIRDVGVKIGVKCVLICFNMPQKLEKHRISLWNPVFLWLRRQDSNLCPVAVPYIFGGGQNRLENIDRCHSLSSFLPPPAAVGSLPSGLWARNEL